MTFPSRKRVFAGFAVAVVGVGVAAGLAGAATSLFLKWVQCLAYGSSSGDVFIALAPGNPLVRILFLSGAGLVTGIGWWALHRLRRSPVSILEAMNGNRMRTLPMLAHTILQLIGVGLGASIGREVAPRELGALAASAIGRLTPTLTARQGRMLIACGAGAGLTAAYDVPVAGALFAVEVLLAEFSLRNLIMASVTSAIANGVSALLIGGGALYLVPTGHYSPSLLVWALLAGPVIGFAATGFSRLTHFATAHRPKRWFLILVMPLTFAGVGALSLQLPEVLGNGQSLAQAALSGALPIAVIAVLFLAKAVTTTVTIGAGAYGGTLTPSLAMGAAFGMVTGSLWTAWWPGSNIAAFALCGAAAFLAGSMSAPLTAAALAIELTGQGLSIAFPLAVTVGISVLVRWLADNGWRLHPLRRLEHTEPNVEETFPT